VIKDELVKMK